MRSARLGAGALRISGRSMRVSATVGMSTGIRRRRLRMVVCFFSLFALLTPLPFVSIFFWHVEMLILVADCGYVCAGDPTEFCGAGNRLSVYKAGAV